jgi:Right handed beta helix region
VAWICILIVLLGAGCGQAPVVEHGLVSARVCDRDPPRGAETPSGSLACRHASEAAPTTEPGFVSRKRGTIAAILSLVSRRTVNPRSIISALAVAATLVATPPADAAERTATPETLQSVFQSAQGGDTILLASGDYGTFRGGVKPGLVTLTPQPGAAVRMAVSFNPASNITIDGVTISDAYLTGGSRSITIRNSDVPGQVWLDTRELQDADITLANDVFHDWDKGAGDGEGRVFLTGGSQPSGVTIRDSEFYGGLSDGIQNGSYGTKIIGNEFHDIIPGSPEGVHADAIQLYGSSHTVIRGNYMHDQPEVPFIMAADGADHELIEDNVVEGSSHGYPYITLFSDDSSIVRHNTFADGSCAFNLPCGILRLGAKDSDDPGQGTVVADNILSEISTEGSTTLAERSHNLMAHDSANGPAELRGNPTYVGGSTPDSYAGYRLAAPSLGTGNASDGTDRGARITETGTPGSGGSDRCEQAKQKVEKAKKNLHQAKRRLQRAEGHKQTRKAKKKLHQANHKLHRAKKAKRRAC